MIQSKAVKIAGFLLLLGIGLVVSFIWNLGNDVGYAPAQPIPFSHKTHAGDNKIPCLYCHTSVDESKHATVPSTNVCMNCHTVVKTDSPLIKQVQESYANNKPIEWIKVHDLPDFVFFNHKRHIAKGVNCTSCHGEVAGMDRVTKVKTLNMGFCVNCHRKEKAPLNCNTCHN